MVTAAVRGLTELKADLTRLAPTSNPLGIGRYVSGIADPFNGRIDQFRIAHFQRSDGWDHLEQHEQPQCVRSGRG
jgi:hypothetical protein